MLEYMSLHNIKKLTFVNITSLIQKKNVLNENALEI